MSKKWNVVIIIADTHGHFTNNLDWGTKEAYGLRDSVGCLKLMKKGYIKFSNAASSAVSSIMAIESIMSGIYAAKTHKLHWRAWPSWDRFDNPVLGSFLKEHGYEVIGFSGLFNVTDWVPCIYCYNPDFYRKFSQYKRDLFSQEAVMAAIEDYFTNAHKKGGYKLFIIHSGLMFKIWDRLMDKFFKNGFNYDNTIFVLTSDHYVPYNFGRLWLLGERDKRGLFHHTDLTEYNNRVLFYLKYPGSKGAEIKTNVAGYDITPTILQLLGLFSEWPAKFDGISLWPLIKGEHVPSRMLRIDNLYPFQIGQEQGRITAIKGPKYKYVYRPDPVSSYIAYRLTEGWSLVLQREEFYDIETDPMEKNNLIDDSSERIQKEIFKCRRFLEQTNREILAFHVGTFRKTFRSNNLANRLFRNPKKGRMLCFQTCCDVVFKTIVNVLREELPDWSIDVVLKKKDSTCVNDIQGIRRKFIYPYDSPYNIKDFMASMHCGSNGRYDCILNTSNFPIGDFANVYDESQFPVGDLTNSYEIIQSLEGDIKATLCIDMSLNFGKSGFRKIPSKLMSLKRQAKINLWKVLIRRVKPYLKTLFSPGPKIDRNLSDRIIHRKKLNFN